MDISRRTLLRAAALPAAAALAGCTFSGTLNGTPSGTLFVEVTNQLDAAETVTVELRQDGQLRDELPAETIPASTSKTFRFDRTGGPYEVRVVADEWSTGYRWELTGCTEKRFRTALSSRDDGTPHVENSTGCVE
ncbi:hypothetical protein [Haloarchaeobius sp. DT45]|uniref:hypothetical protein n=1 Tax=Haloarchaeobius sp. DT45 TaxID=3446116 RepID=UPI003F6AA55E